MSKCDEKTCVLFLYYALYFNDLSGVLFNIFCLSPSVLLSVILMTVTPDRWHDDEGDRHVGWLDAETVVQVMML